MQLLADGNATAMVKAELEVAFERFQRNAFPHAGAKSSAGAVEVTVKDGAADLQLGVSEAYELDVPATFYSSGSAVATIQAETVFGAYRGLETLSQLIRFDFGSSSYVVDGAPIKISDAPRFPHREILLDSARHYEPVRVIEAILDSLAYAKLNTLHWHMSFPFVAPSHPELAEAAAFSPGERYTAGDVAAVVAYARSLGIRVVVEVDTPGHAASFCKSNPHVCPAPDCPEPLLISNNASFELIGDIFADFAAVTTDEVFHLGGDEVRYDCWNKSDAMKAWMAAEKLATFDDAYAYAVQRVAAGVKAAHGRAAIVWGEAWDTFGPSARSSWEAEERCEFPPRPRRLARRATAPRRRRWGETADPSDIMQTLWPRLAAIAEVLWSPPHGANATAAALPRLEAFRCVLEERGVAAAPVSNPLARAAPTGPGSCRSQ
ncbi:N-acetyl-beta-D-galactosaminidase [Aureococcus anophagefferens]|uniref:beta-N-acetylhexosaminidase n=1 Tax=Aureococcus anophagefferens TaxID=44056 RepID=A0ABR1G000_AURAN